MKRFVLFSFVLCLVVFGVAPRLVSAVSVSVRAARLSALQSQVYRPSPDIASEYKRSEAAVDLNANYQYEVIADFRGRYFTYVGGVRGTSWQPSTYSATIYLFGSSTLAEQSFPDDLTIASQLQALVNKAHLAYRVINEGNPAMNAGLEVGRLMGVALRPGDIIVFYDGGTDIYAPSAYLGWLRQARTYVNGRGAAFYSILQPQIFSRPLTDFEQQVVANLPDDYQQAAIALRAAWPTLQAANRAIGGLDLTHVLDAMCDATPVYLDYLHVGPQASPIIARAIADAITVL